jgi:tRNA(Arg) A34 adenosine deaminase TadA
MSLAPSIGFAALAAPWRVAFEASIKAYLEGGSVPIGAAIVDAGGNVLAVGANDFASARLAHAELVAINALPATAERNACMLYVTVEPCPMCVGAIRMAQLRAVHFAARDPAAGSAGFLDATPFMRAFATTTHGPAEDRRDLEFVVVALVTEHRARTGHPRWEAEWLSYLPEAVAAGKSLVASGAYASWRETRLTAAELYTQVLSIARRR